MASSEEQAKTDSNTSLKLAITMALLRSKLLQKPRPPPHLHHPSASPSSQSTSQKWKRKAKDRKQELLRLKEDLKQAEDNSQCDLFPQSASCVCYFFDKLGELSPNRFLDGSDRRFNDVLRRRFLRRVRLNERRRRDSSTQQHCFFGADVNLKNDGSRTALHYAASKGWLKISEILLSHGAKINLKDKVGCTPLHLAASTGNSELCEFLIEEGAEVDAIEKAGYNATGAKPF